MKKRNLAVFISGQGSNLEVILQKKQLWNSILVLSSKAEARGLQRAQKHAVPSLTLARKIDWDDVHNILQSKKIDLIFLAGFMKIVPPDFLNAWQGEIFNLHPSWLPGFKGLKAIERAYAARKGVGVTIHHVVPDVDSGEIVLQDWAVREDEIHSLSLEQVVERTHQKEHELVGKWVDQYSQIW